MAQRETVVVGFALVLDNFHVAVGLHTAAGHQVYREKKLVFLHVGNADRTQGLQTGRVVGDGLH